MGGFFRYTGLLPRHLRITVFVTADIFAGEGLVPDASGGISAVSIVKMISVAAKGVTKACGTTILNCLSTIYHFYIYHFLICNLLYIISASLDGVPHLLLVGVVTRISRVLGISAVRPCLHPTELCGRLVRADGVNKHRQPGFIGRTNTAVVAGLLERDEVIRTVPECLSQADSIFDDARSRIGTDAMGVSRRVFEHELRVLLQRATAIIQVMNLHLYAFFRAQRYQFLLHRIAGETIPYA